MSMMSMIEAQALALGIGFGDLILLLVLFCSIIFAAIEIRIGVIIWFMLNIGTLIVFVAFGYPLRNVVVVMFLSFVILTFMLYMTYSKRGQGAA